MHTPELIVSVIILLVIISLIFVGVRIVGSSIGRGAAREYERIHRDQQNLAQ